MPILCVMTDDNAEAICVGGHGVPATDPSILNSRARRERPSRADHQTTSGPSFWSRRASVAEMLVAFGVILLALVSICTARGDETFPFSVVKPKTEAKSFSLRMAEH